MEKAVWSGCGGSRAETATVDEPSHQALISSSGVFSYMNTQRDSQRSTALLGALFVGVVHTAVVGGVVARLDYPVQTFESLPGGVAGAAVGLVTVVAVPVFVLLRYRVVLPALAATVGVAWPIYRAVTTPAPEFSTLGGYTIVDGTRYVDAYANGWYVWLLASVLLGLTEYVVRRDHEWLPSPARSTRLDQWLRREQVSARRLAAVVGVAHAAVFLLLAGNSGYVRGGFLPSPWYVGLGVAVWTLLGLLLVGGLPVYLLVRTRLVAPSVVFAWLVSAVGWAQLTPRPDDSLPVYFIGWVFFAGVLFVVGGVEYGLRRVGRWSGLDVSSG